MGSNWQYATIPAYDTRPDREVDPRDKPLSFELTQSERSKVASYACALEDNRRKQNARDTVQAAAYALSKEDQA